MEAAAGSRGGRRRASRRHKIRFIQGGKELLPRNFSPFDHEVGHRVLGIGCIEILDDDAGTVFKAEDEIIAAALQQRIRSCKIKLDASVRNTLNDCLCPCRGLDERDVGHEESPYELKRKTVHMHKKSVLFLENPKIER